MSDIAPLSTPEKRLMALCKPQGFSLTNLNIQLLNERFHLAQFVFAQRFGVTLSQNREKVAALFSENSQRIVTILYFFQVIANVFDFIHAVTNMQSERQ
jgi:DNA-binding transcriptional regulator YiaG